MIKTLFNIECILVVIMLLAMVAQRFQLLPFKLAFGGFSLALLVTALLSVVALVMLLLSFGVISADVRSSSAAAFAVGAVPLVLVILLVGAGFKVPKIHDISTDLNDPLHFVHAKTLRTASENSLEIPSLKVMDLQRSHYVALAPLSTADTAATTYEKALQIAADLGWQVVYKSPETFTFEASESTALFGFVDDVVVRVRETDSGSVIDLRSVSRVGVSDLGANAKRIERFQAAYLKESF